MRLLATLSILSSVLALAAASAGSTKAEAEALKLADSVLHPVVEVREAEPETSMLEVRKPKELQGRACIENGCTCKKVKRGQYCGSCQQVLTYGKNSDIFDIFECNPQGGCCSYGPANDCKPYSEAIKHCPR